MVVGSGFVVSKLVVGFGEYNHFNKGNYGCDTPLVLIEVNHTLNSLIAMIKGFFLLNYNYLPIIVDYQNGIVD